MPEEITGIAQETAGGPLAPQRRAERFAASAPSAMVPGTANEKDRTVDVCWYAGATVPRIDPETGQEYMLRLDMAGCRLERLNQGAPVLDSHMTGADFRSMMAQCAGVDAQIGAVVNGSARADGPRGMATLKFAQGDEKCDAAWMKIQQGVVQNLSFGAWIYAKEPEVAGNGGTNNVFVATDWEPFEISIVTVPADAGATFLSAAGSPPAKPTVAETRASAHREENPAMPEETKPQGTGDEARVTEQALAAARDEAVKAERQRANAIRTMAAPFKLEEKFVTALIDEGASVETARERIMAKLVAQYESQPTHPVNPTVTLVADATDKRRECMEAAVLYRAEPQIFGRLKDKAQQYRGSTLYDMARECLEAAGVKTRGMSRNEIVIGALRAPGEFAHYFSGAHTTSDFPNILANIANKSLRQAYEAAPPTFRAVARQVGVSDFKQAKSVQLSDLAALQKVNEKGEFKRLALSDNGEPYALGTYGNVVSITRQVVINDDLQTLVRVPAQLGTAAARTESDVFWSVITTNGNMSDGVPIFHANHNNLLTGADSAFGDTGLGAARAAMRLQKAPKGTILNYVPRYVVGPAALEHTILKFVNPMQLAASQASNVIPQWITQLTPVIEGRLDANSTTAWYLVAEGDGAIYCYLEGQEGVYTETRNGFDVDGVEIKARLDFAAAMIEYRTWQKNAGA
jgi:hypothetical protein